ncbi:MAG TPA: N-acetyl-gamma-glutamyl-phosphate reductase [Puia sp.]|nr:N-acetyl-gamma-glutamyl-phosphate reductase [Puia sp.]
MKSITAGIIGGAGYTGGEMIRLLIAHPAVDIRFVHSKSNAGKPVYSVHEDLVGETTLAFDAAWNGDVDVLFLCVGHGEAATFVKEAGSRLDGVRVIDLSQDFRLNAHGWVYGLPELDREAIRGAKAVANPGCFATAIQLGLLPLAKAGLLSEVYTTGITGSTGAGQGLSPTSHFSWRANNIQAYKTLTHQHLREIRQTLGQLQGDAPAVHFVPWRGDFTRGIFVSSQLRCRKSAEEVFELFEDYYNDHPFTHVSRTPVSLKQVVNTNKCLIQLEKEGDQLVVHSALDNLLKGASGQAVQNMNLVFGLEEATGLQLKSIAF